MESDLLYFNKEEGVFAPSKNTTKEKTSESYCSSDCEKQLKLSFVDDPACSKIAALLQFGSNQDYISAALVLDTGSEANVATSAGLDALQVPYRSHLKEPGLTQYQGPAGAKLHILGNLKIWVKIKNIERGLNFVVLKGNSNSIILGNEGMAAFRISITPGQGAAINVRSCQRIKHQEAAAAQGSLSPWIFPVQPETEYSIPRFSKRYVPFIPQPCKEVTAEKLHAYAYQWFLFRPHLCVYLTNEECDHCKQHDQDPPFQIVRLEGGRFNVCFENNNNFEWRIERTMEFAVEFCPMQMSRKDLAADLLVAFDLYPPVLPLTEKEAEWDYESQLSHLKGQLAELICEPPAFTVNGFEGPTLRIHPEPPPPTFSNKHMSIQEYINTNPCPGCSNQNLLSCDPKQVYCVTRKLYEDQLVEHSESQEVIHDKPFPLDIYTKKKCAHIWIIRPNLSEMIGWLKTKYADFDCACEMVQGASGPNVTTMFVHLGIAPVISAATEALLKVAKFCESMHLYEIHFPNLECILISRQRVRRIFNNPSFRLHIFCPHPQFGIVDPNFRDPAAPPRGRGLPPRQAPIREQTLQGLPGPIRNEDVRQAEEQGRKEGRVSEIILCNDEKVREDTIALLDSHPLLWAKSAFDVGLFRHKDTGKPVHFTLKLKYFENTVTAPRFVSPARQEAAKEVLSGLLKQGVVETRYSRNRLNAVYVPKKALPISKEEWVKIGRKESEWAPGTPHPHKPVPLRLTVDLSPTNKLLQPLPMLPCDPRDILSAIQNNRFISCLDISLAFNSLLLSRESADLQGFCSGIKGMPPLVFSRVAMGATSSSMLLQCSMHHALKECLEYTFVLADDVIIFSDSEQDMLKRLSKVFQCLEKCNFRLKKEKLLLYLGSKSKTVEIFGLLIDLEKKIVRPVAKKVDEIISRPLPSTISGMRSLLGALNWQGGFLAGGAQHHAILHAMTRAKEGSYDLSWTEQRLVAIEFFLDKLGSPDCLLHLPDPKKVFYIASDASLKSCGYYLWQESEEGRPMVISYQARVFTDRQSSLPVYEREGMAALMAISSFWSYIEGRPTILYTDSTTSFYISFFSRTNNKVARFRIFLQSLDWLQVVWRPASDKRLLIADYLSRRSICPKKKVNQQSKKGDILYAEEVTSKLKKEFCYSLDASSYVIDYVTSLSPEELEQLPVDSVYMDADGQIKVDSTGSLHHPHALDHREEQLKEVQQQEEQKLAKEEPLAPLSSSQPSPASSSLPATQSTSILPPTSDFLYRKDHESMSMKGEQGSLSTEEMTMEPKEINQCCPRKILRPRTRSIRAIIQKKVNEDNDKNEEIGSGLASLLDEQSLTSTALSNIYCPPDSYFKPPSSMPALEGTSRVDKFLFVIQKESPGVRFQDLRQAQENDPHSSELIKKCEQKKEKYFCQDGRINYFLAGPNDILCREIQDPISKGTQLQVVIPAHWGFDLAIMAHRCSRLYGGVGAGVGPHLGPLKMAKLLSRRFYIRNLLKLLQIISRSCQICTEHKPGIRNRPNYFRRTMTIYRPAQGWYLDELKLSSVQNKWGFTSVLTIVCAFSHFLVVAPIKQPLTQDYVLELLYSYVFNFFGLPKFLVADNSSVFVGKLIQDCCIFLNISLNSTPRYQPRANISEYLNRLLLAALSIQKESFALANDSYHLALCHAVTSINFSPFINAVGDDSPARRFFGESALLQNCTLSTTCFDQIEQLYPSADDRAKEGRKVLNALASLRQLHSRQRQEQLSGNVLRHYLEVGDLVTVRYRPYPQAGGAHKLQRKYRFIFTIVYISGATAYIRPYSTGALSRYLKYTDEAFKAKVPTPVLPCFKCSVSDLKKVQSGLQLFSSNSKKFHFSEFSPPSPPQNRNFQVYTPAESYPCLIGKEDPEDLYSNYEELREPLSDELISRNRSDERTYFMDDSGNWMDVQTGEAVDENILGEAPPEEIQGRLPLDTEQNLDQEEEQQGALIDKALEEPHPPLRRSKRIRKPAWKIRNVSQLNPALNPGKEIASEKEEERKIWLKMVQKFFETGEILKTPKPDQTYETIIDKLDGQFLEGKVNNISLLYNCKCFECTFGEKSGCEIKPCKLCNAPIPPT